MSDAQAAPPQTQLAPSEVVLLHGDRFAGEAGMLATKEELLTRDAKVSADQLAESILAAVLLANEAAGCLRLEAREKKVLFGLMKRRTLYADRGDRVAAWPEGSLEAQLRGAFRGDSTEVDDLLYDLLREDVPSPALEVMLRVKGGLAGRGVLERVEVKRLKVFTTYEYRLPERTTELLRTEPAEPVRGLLDECQRSRPEVWQLLKKHVGSALSRRREVDNDHDFND